MIGQQLLRDVRDATRSALRQPGLSLVIVLTLAIGIGANTAIFTLLSELYQPDVRAPDADRLFYLQTGTVDQPAGGASYLDALAYREALDNLGRVGLQRFFGAVLGLPGQGAREGENRYSLGVATSPEYFELHGAGFAMGRGFLDSARNSSAEAVVSYAYWRRHLGSDASILGKDLRVNNVRFTVVGVTARDFRPGVITMPIHVPVGFYDEIVAQAVLDDRDARPFTCLVRLDEGITPETVEARLAALATHLDREHPWPEGKKRHLSLMGVGERAKSPESRDLMIAGAVGLLLLLASANVANLLLARAAGRRREIAVHAALGAGRWRIARRLLAESVLLAVFGGALGVVFGRWIVAYVRVFLDVGSIGLPDFSQDAGWLALDVKVLLFTLGISVATGCFFGLAPVLHAIRTDLVAALKGMDGDASPGRRFGARKVLVVVQVTLATVLLLGAGLLIRSLAVLESRPLGFEIGHQLLAALSTAPSRGETAEARRHSRRELYELARGKLAEIPGVASATLGTNIPANGWGHKVTLSLPEWPDEELRADRLTIGSDYFETLGYGLIEGRSFDHGDRAGAQGAAIVNQAFVERFWNGGQALGRKLSLPGLVTDAADDHFVVVGVAEDVRHASRRDPPVPLVYLPLAQHLVGSRIYAIARTVAPPGQILRQAREVLATA